MDFMKVLDQTVREIKREVNIKVLKVPEIEQKVLDATSDEPWGPHGSALAEIAKATKKFTECQMIMDALWTRLTEGDRNWRHVYKALAVIEYLMGHGSERAVDDIIEHSFQISSLSGFEYVESNGKDMGINVRKKAETILALLTDNNKIQEVRDKAAATQNKFFGLSSTGITCNSSSTSHGSISNQHGGGYGGLSGRKEGETFKDSYIDRGRSGEDDFGKRGRDLSRRGVTGKSGGKNVKNKDHDALSSSSSRQFSKFNQSDDNHSPIHSQSSAAPTGLEDDSDDFDPRGTSNAEKAVSVNEVDLFGNFMDAPTSVPPQMSTVNDNATAEVDLFADAAYISATPHEESGASSQSPAAVDLFASQPSASSTTVDFFTSPQPVPQTETKSQKSENTVDLFASQPAFPSASSSTVDFSMALQPVPLTETKSQQTETVSSHNVDPFAGVPANSFDGTDLFGAFTSHTDHVATDPTKNSVQEGNLDSIDQKTSTEPKPLPKKDAFQVKSGIWADSLTRGLIDLNITAPKKVDLSDIGIVGGLSDGTDEKEKVNPTSAYMGGAIGMGPGHVSSGFTSSPGIGIGDSSSSSSIFSTLSQQHQQQQYGSYSK